MPLNSEVCLAVVCTEEKINTQLHVKFHESEFNAELILAMCTSAQDLSHLSLNTRVPHHPDRHLANPQWHTRLTGRETWTE